MLEACLPRILRSQGPAVHSPLHICLICSGIEVYYVAFMSFVLYVLYLHNASSTILEIII